MSHPRGRTFVDVLEINARRFQDLPPPPKDKWTESFVPTNGTSALIVDVYNSTSLSAVGGVAGRYSEDALGCPVAAYSYYRVERHYLAVHSQQDVFVSSKLLVPYLPVAARNAVLPIGASAGGVVVLLGVAAWVRESELAPAELAKCVPQVILVAPAVSPPEEIFHEYLQLRKGVREGVPQVIMQFCDKQSLEWLAVQKAVTEAIALLAWARIEIRVAYWPPDILTPYPWDADVQRIASSFIEPHGLAPADLFPPDVGDAAYEANCVVAHLSFCIHGDTISKVRGFLPQP